MKVETVLVVMLMFVFGIAIFIILNNYILNLDTSSWSFSGYEVITSILPFIPWIFIVALIMVPTYILFKEA